MKLYGIASLLALANVSCKPSKSMVDTVPDNKGWVIVQTDTAENPEWTIYMKNEKGSSFYEYKIEGRIDAPPEVCIASFKNDIYNRANGKIKAGDYEYTTYTILYESSDTLVVYAIHKEPFPRKNTEMNIRYIFNRDTSGNVGVTWKEAWDDFPKEINKKLDRIETFRGSWQFEDKSDTSYKAINIVQFNLKGPLPMWLVQPMVTKFLRGGFEDFKGKVPNQNASKG